MTLHRTRSKLDMTSVGFLVVGVVFFLVAAILYSISVAYIVMHPGELPPSFSLAEIGNFFGIGGMAILPLFIITAIIVNVREKRRDQKTGNDLDDNPEPGATERS